MSFADAVASGFRNYASSAGRASRSEYWFWVLFTLLVILAADVLDVGLGTNTPDASGAFQLVSDLALIFPNFAVGIRRLHDLGRAGWWLLFALVPIIGWALLLIWSFTRGTSGPNRFGEDPLAGEALAVT